MNVKALFQLYNENDPVDEPFWKEFSTIEEVYAWLREQHGHPWLSLSLVKITNKAEEKL